MQFRKQEEHSEISSKEGQMCRAEESIWMKIISEQISSSSIKQLLQDSLYSTKQYQELIRQTTNEIIRNNSFRRSNLKI
jgi:hypothetical protein